VKYLSGHQGQTLKDHVTFHETGKRMTRPAGYTYGRVAQRSTKDHMTWLNLRPCLVPSWCGA